MRDLEAAILGRSNAPKTRPGGNIVEGQVHSVATEGMYFTVSSWDEGKHMFGPAPWDMSQVEKSVSGTDAAHDHTGTSPQKGDRALIVFVGEGVQNPWVIGWWAA